MNSEKGRLEEKTNKGGGVYESKVAIIYVCIYICVCVYRRCCPTVGLLSQAHTQWDRTRSTDFTHEIYVGPFSSTCENHIRMLTCKMCPARGRALCGLNFFGHCGYMCSLRNHFQEEVVVALVLCNQADPAHV